MEYNSARNKLIIPEYGRNVQMLIEHAKTIEDDEYRQAFVEKIVHLIQSMYPQTRNVEDYKTKLWSHVLRIAKYDLKVQTPDNVTYEDDIKKRPESLNYPAKDVSFRHYGHNVQQLIKKAVEMEDPEKKQEFALVIAGYMKMAYKNWNKNTVSDEMIKSNLAQLSKGELIIPENVALDTHYTTSRRKNNNSGKRGSNNNYSNSKSKKRDYKKRYKN